MEADLGRPMLEPETRSPDPGICPFLRAVDGADLIEPFAAPDDANRCLASGPALEQTHEWQQNACLVPAHMACPRYLLGARVDPAVAPAAHPTAPARGTAAKAPSRPERAATSAVDTEVAPTTGAVPAIGSAAAAESAATAESAAPTADVDHRVPEMVGVEVAEAAAAGMAASDPAGPVGRPSRTLTPAIVLSLLLLIGSAAAAVSFAAATGGLQLPTRPPVAVVLPSATPRPTVAPTVAATPAPTLEPSPVPTIAPTPSPLVTIAPTVAPSPAPTSNRYALLIACPDKPDCYLYTIRSGDNLSSIASYFGVPYDTVLKLNPNLALPIQPGDVIVLPPPTR